MNKLIAIAFLAVSSVTSQGMSCPVCGPKPHCPNGHFCAQDAPTVTLADTFTVHISPLGTDPEPGVR